MTRECGTVSADFSSIRVTARLIVNGCGCCKRALKHTRRGHDLGSVPGETTWVTFHDIDWQPERVLDVAKIAGRPCRRGRRLRPQSRDSVATAVKSSEHPGRDLPLLLNSRLTKPNPPL